MQGKSSLLLREVAQVVTSQRTQPPSKMDGQIPNSPLPMCRLVFSMVELRLTLESSPRQNLFLLFEGSVKPSTRMLVEDAWNASPTRLFSS